MILIPGERASAAVDLVLNEADLRFILDQIRIGEATALRDASPPATTPVLEANSASLTQAPVQTPIAAIQAEWTRVNGTTITEAQAALQPWGIRQVDGRNNNISDPDRVNFGASDEIFPRLTLPDWRRAGIDATTTTPCGDAFTSTAAACGDYGPNASGANPYANRQGVRDYHPRLVSNLISDQTTTNPAAAAASNRPDPADGSVLIPNVSPTLIAAPYNGVFSLFGQYFDHGLDLVQKSSTEKVVIPLMPSDPLMGQLNGSPPFMLLSRTKLDANGDAINAVTPWIDQNQTYTSHPAHQVFLREYVPRGNVPVATGKFLDGGRCSSPSSPTAATCDLPTWSEVKTQALNLLGIELDDMNVHDVPLVLTDQYGRFIRSISGYPMVLMQDAQGARQWKSGTPGSPLKMVDRTTGERAVGTGHAFLDDIAHGAAPSENPDGSLKTYNSTLLNSHFITGDGRGNENIGLTSIHLVFHAEHNRLVNDVKRVLCTSGDDAFRAQWTTNGTVPCSGSVPLANALWNGERLFQASKFVNEMEYQHLIFDTFARKVQPAIRPFVRYNPNVAPEVTAEFAHAVYRYGHSQLNATIRRQYGGPLSTIEQTEELPLLNAFLNPAQFGKRVNDAPIATAAESAGAVFQGMVNQVGNEIDEFVTNTLRNNLLGLPLDLPALNMTRARDAGTPTLNGARQAFYGDTGDASLMPYDNWLSFRQALRHDASIVNFIAAYGKEHPLTPTAGAKLQDLRAAAATDADLITKLRDRATVLLTDSDFLLGIVPGTNNNPAPTRFDNGINGIDLWVGGLAEQPQTAAGMLGSTFDYVFKSQMEYLQNGDRFYYLARTAGMNLGNQLGLNTWGDMVMRNTTATALPFDVFSFPTTNVSMASQPVAGQMVQTAEVSPLSPPAPRVWLWSGPCKISGVFVHLNIFGTPNQDAFEGGCGDDTLRGQESDDYLRGGNGNDNYVGGAGNEMMYDRGGLSIFSGEGGDDYMVGGNAGLDTYDGGAGSDMVIGGNEGAIFDGGAGNDFAYGSSAADVMSGDDGDDWLEGSVDADLLNGDVGALAGLITNGAGRDVMLGGMDDDLMSGGEQMDIGVDWQGIDTMLGGFGFDWMSYSTARPAQDKVADVDLGVLVAPPPNVFPVDVFNEVEGVSGGSWADIIRGDSFTSFIPVPAIPGGVDDSLTGNDIATILGLNTLVLAGTPAAGLTGTARWSSGNILLGGGGGDIIEGRGGNDIIHGNASLRVYLSVPGNLAPIGTKTLASVTVKPDPTPAATGRVLVESLFDVKPWLDNRALTASQIIVRRVIENAASDSAVDTAVFTNPRANYIVSFNPTTGVTTVVDNSPAGTPVVDGTDYLRGIERLQFGPVGNQTVLTVPTAPGGVVMSPTTATTNSSLTVTWGSVTANPPVTGYVVSLYTTDVGDTLATTTAVNPCRRLVSENNRTCTFTGLQPGSMYFAQVHAYNDVGLSSPPIARTPWGTRPPAPTGVTVSAPATRTIRVTWPSVTANPAITSYEARAYASNATQPEGLCRVSPPGPSVTQTCDITGLRRNVTYSVRVVAVNQYGTSAESASVSIRTR